MNNAHIWVSAGGWFRTGTVFLRRGCAVLGLVIGLRLFPGGAGVLQADAAMPDSYKQLLPPPLRLAGLWPDLSLSPGKPATAPPDCQPVYHLRTWRRFRREFGAAAAAVIFQSPADRIALARKMLNRARATHDRGYRRLLCIRAFALAFRWWNGAAPAQRALTLYLQNSNLKDPAQVAPIWTMCNDAAYLRTMPPADRDRYDKLAEAANTQLVLELLSAGQLAAARRVVRLLVIHETLGVRADPPLLSAMGTARILVHQTREMIDFLAARWRRRRTDPAAAMDIYLYARYVQPLPALRARILRRWPAGPITVLDRTLRTSRTVRDADYQAGRQLARAAQPLPWGILRDRILFAALRHYRAFLVAPATRHDRIRRTLARIAAGQLLEEGARPNPDITPLAAFLPAPTTGPAGPSKTYAPQ